LSSSAARGWGWRYDGLESWPNEKIFAQLRELGIDTDAQHFHQQALTAGRMKVLDDDWSQRTMPLRQRKEV